VQYGNVGVNWPDVSSPVLKPVPIEFIKQLNLCRLKRHGITAALAPLLNMTKTMTSGVGHCQDAKSWTVEKDVKSTLQVPVALMDEDTPATASHWMRCTDAELHSVF
jgi:hypothetical protein